MSGDVTIKDIMQRHDPAADISFARLNALEARIMAARGEQQALPAGMPVVAASMAYPGYLGFSVMAVLLLVLGGYVGVALDQQYGTTSSAATETASVTETALLTTPWHNWTY